MIPRIEMLKPLLVGMALSLVVAACASAPQTPEGASDARNRLIQLQSNPELASRATLEINEAEAAVRAAEQPRQDKELEKHLLLMANGKVDIAAARAQSRLLVDQRKALSQAQETVRLEARTREADRARSDATISRNEADVARIDADSARADAAMARGEAETARLDTVAAQEEADELQREIADLNAAATERGLVVTLGDVLFATGRAELKAGAAGHLGKLAAFLDEHGDRTVIIEGHADSVGSEESNVRLSQRRADAVKSYLVGQGIDTNRLVATGKGESVPIADNASVSGREQNRRVEVVISNG